MVADKCHMECYLETQEKNTSCRPYYEKFGCKSVAKNDLFRDGSDDIRLPGHVLVRESK